MRTSIDIITVCQNRLESFKLAYKTWVDRSVAATVVVVSADLAVQSWACESLKTPPGGGLKLPQGKLPFNLNAWRNQGADESDSNLLLFLPCDACLSPGFVGDLVEHQDKFDILMSKGYYEKLPTSTEYFGVIGIRRITFTQLGGFTEALEQLHHSPGYLSEDFLDRAIKRFRRGELRLSLFDEKEVSFIQHDIESRVQNYTQKDLIHGYQIHREMSRGTNITTPS